MPVQTTSNLSNSVRTRYLDKYVEAAMFERLYDQISTPIPKVEAEDAAINGSSVQVNFLSDLPLATAAISQTTDITPRTLRDATASITPTSRADAIQWAELVDIQAYTNYGEQRFKAIGKQAAESIDLLAKDASLAGGNVYRAVARASLDAGTAGHNLTDSKMVQIDSRLQALKCPAYIGEGGRKQWIAIMHPDVFHDLRTGGNVLTVGQYQKAAILLNWELGEIGSFKLVVSPWAHVYGAAGADAASVVATTLNGAVNALAKSIVVTSAINVTANQLLTIGTEETGTTLYPDNELVRVNDDYVSGTTVNVIGEGANGGLRFDHASLVAVRNADNAYPVVFGSPMSLAKLFAPQIGEFGEVIGPKKGGAVDQFATLGWKFYGGYGRWVESWLVRGEFSSSLQA